MPGKQDRTITSTRPPATRVKVPHEAIVDPNPPPDAIGDTRKIPPREPVTGRQER